MTTPNPEAGATPAVTPGAIPAVLPVSTAAAQGVGQAAGATPTTPTSTTDTTNPQGAGQAGAAPQAQQQQDPKASDPAVLRADLAGERDKRQAAEAARKAADDKLTAVLTALGIGGENATQQTPEQIAQAAQASERAARLELAAVRSAPQNVNVAALLDSRAFSATLGALDPANGPAIQAAIVEFVKDKPQYLTVRYGAGTGDAAASGDPGTGAKTMDDLMRGR